MKPFVRIVALVIVGIMVLSMVLAYAIQIF